MNIQKSRITAIISVLVLVCSMVAVMVIPASAASEPLSCFPVDGVSLDDVAFAVFKDAGCESDFSLEDYQSAVYSAFLGTTIPGFLSDDKSTFLVNSACITNFESAHTAFCGCSLFDMNDERYRAYLNLEDQSYYFAVSMDTSNLSYEDSQVIFEYTGSNSSGPVSPTPTAPTAPTTDSGLSKVVNKDMLTGVLNEVISLLPIVIPVIVGFIGLRKGISFLQNILHSA